MERKPLHLSPGGETQETRLTYLELEQRALAIAALLQSQLSPGKESCCSTLRVPSFQRLLRCLCAACRRAYLSSIFHPVPGKPRGNGIDAGPQSHSPWFHPGRIQAPNRSDSRTVGSQMDINRHHPRRPANVARTQFVLIPGFCNTHPVPRKSKGVMVSHGNLLHNHPLSTRSLEPHRAAVV